jgi:hypothetical protein
MIDEGHPNRLRSDTGLPTPAEAVAMYEEASGVPLEQLGWFAALVRYKQAAVSAIIAKNNRKVPQPGVDVDRMKATIPVADWATSYLNDGRRGAMQNCTSVPGHLAPNAACADGSTRHVVDHRGNHPRWRPVAADDAALGDAAGDGLQREGQIDTPLVSWDAAAMIGAGRAWSTSTCSARDRLEVNRGSPRSRRPPGRDCRRPSPAGGGCATPRRPRRRYIARESSLRRSGVEGAPTSRPRSTSFTVNAWAPCSSRT